MVSGIMKAVGLYKAIGLTIVNVHADNEFECCRAELRPIILDIAGAGMHVGEVERSIRTIKERVRCIHDLPFKNYPRALVVENSIEYDLLLDRLVIRRY